MMTKKDFIALADALRPVLAGSLPSHKDAPMIDALVSFMRGQNPKFNEARWRAYLAGTGGSSGGKIPTKAVKAARAGLSPAFCDCGHSADDHENGSADAECWNGAAFGNRCGCKGYCPVGKGA